jgi:small multidrug resistance family-3 protein
MASGAMAILERHRLLIEFSTMLLAAALEVGGDALIRAGLRSSGWVLVAAGFVVLGSYGVVVNLLPMDFSKLLGTYVAFFAVVSVAFGKIAFGDVIPISTWIGLAVIVLGSAIIQIGRLA